MDAKRLLVYPGKDPHAVAPHVVVAQHVKDIKKRTQQAIKSRPHSHSPPRDPPPSRSSANRRARATVPPTKSSMAIGGRWLARLRSLVRCAFAPRESACAGRLRRPATPTSSVRPPAPAPTTHADVVCEGRPEHRVGGPRPTTGMDRLEKVAASTRPPDAGAAAAFSACAAAATTVTTRSSPACHPDVSTRVFPCAAGRAAADSVPGPLSAQAGPAGRLTVGPGAVTATGGTGAARTAAAPRAGLLVASSGCHRVSGCHGGCHGGGYGSHPPPHGAMAPGGGPLSCGSYAGRAGHGHDARKGPVS